MKRKNIVFSTTKQWNPGDEIILKGIINIFDALGLNYNPLIFNRNPSVRRLYGNSTYSGMTTDDFFLMKHIDISMMDNSMKPWLSYENIDLIVMAGTPEWSGGRNRELFLRAIKNNIPVCFLGIDGDYNKEQNEVVSSVLEKSKIILVRNQEVLNSFVNKGIGAQFFPCPSLLSSKNEKHIEEVHTIGLIYRAKNTEITLINGWDENSYIEQNAIFNSIIKQYGKKTKIVIICHYVDELILAERDFNGVDIYYSYNSDDYFKIYEQCDLVIGSRIHGIGLATSLGIPSIPLKYDFRAGTYKGFYPDDSYFDNSLNVNDKIDYYINNISDINEKLIEYKQRIKSLYISELSNLELFDKVTYDDLFVEIPKERINDALRWFVIKDKEISYSMTKRVIDDALSSINQIIKNKKVLIKGGGNHTTKMLEYLTPELKVVGIIDNSITSFQSYHVYRNDDICNLDFDYIIISSFYYREEMFKELSKYIQKSKIISIYKVIEDNYAPLEKPFFQYLEELKL